MSDAEGTSAPVDGGQPAPQGGSGPEAGGNAPQTGGGNPNYDSIRSKLGPSFSLVENDLKEMDRLANERITRSNADLKRYTDLGDFDSIQQAYGLAGRLNSDPRGVYDLLGQYLSQQGLLDDIEDDDDVEYDEDGVEIEPSPQDLQLQQLQAAQEQMQGYLSQQEQARAEAQAEQELDSQMQSIRQANPHFTDADEARIYRFAYAAALANESDPDLEAAAAELNSLRTEFLSAPRAGDSAPRLVPSNGGLPRQGEPVSRGKQKSQDTQSDVVAMLRANRSQLGL
jgi:hypothetical protein